MESLERSSAVIDLGKKLVAQLELSDDVPAQWMAHMLAERIRDAETATPETKAAAQSACAEVVYQLWERRYSLPSQLRPLKQLEPLFRTLLSLDVSSGQRFRYFPEPFADADVEEGPKKLFEMAKGVDNAGRVLVQYFLAAAAEESSGETRAWIQSAVDAEADATLEVRVIGLLDGGLELPADVDEVAREALEDKIGKLEAFAFLAASHAARLRERHDLLAVDGEGEPETDD